jgi:PmbA protein
MLKNIMNTIELIKQIAKEKNCFIDFLIVDKNIIDTIFNGKKPEKIEISQSLNVGIKIVKDNKSFIINSLDLSELEIRQKIDEALIAIDSLIKNDVKHFDVNLGGYNQSQEIILKNENNLDENHKLNEIKDKINEFDENILKNKNIVTCENGFNREHVYYYFGNSLGFKYFYEVFYDYLFSKVVAKDLDNETMEIGYEFDSKNNMSDLLSINEITKKANEKAIKSLNPKKGLSGNFDVVINKNILKELIGYFLELVNGENVRQKNSFLKDSLGLKIFQDGVNIVDLPKYKNGYYNLEYDMQGGKCEDLFLVENGFLKNFTLDVETSLKLNMVNNCRGFRTISSDYKPCNTNIVVENKLKKQNHELDEVLLNIKKGYYINKTMGMGVNLVNGDYSKGACGFYVENGKVIYPVNNIPIAGNLKQIFAELEIFDDIFDKKMNIFCGYAIMKNIVVASS